jgi:hypothetical protein
MKILVYAITSIPLACAAQPFTDLTLDNPNLSGLSPVGTSGLEQGATSHLLPGWTLTQDGVPMTQMYFAPLGVETYPYVTLRQNASSLDPLGLGPYSLVLWTYKSPDGGVQGTDIRMSQTGQIPANAAGLQIAANADVQVYLNGSYVGAVDIEKNAVPIFDVSQYSGRTVDLEVRFPQTASLTFDVLGFRTVPEPSTWALFGLGAGFIGWQLWRRRSGR